MSRRRRWWNGSQDWYQNQKLGTDELRFGTYCWLVMQGQGFHVLFLALPVKTDKGLNFDEVKPKAKSLDNRVSAHD